MKAIENPQTLAPACTQRRRLLVLGTASAALLDTPAWARAGLPPMTDGPFYPPPRWRATAADWDADLTRVRRGSQTLVAQGEHLALELRVVDGAGKAIDRVAFEIWQCDSAAQYRHPRVEDSDGRADKGFQGFGAAHTNATGEARFRTIKPVPYPGRTPHIHVKLRHPAFRELSSQLFIAGDPGNTRDFIWRQLGAPEQAAVDLILKPARGDGLSWQTQHTLVVQT